MTPCSHCKKDHRSDRCPYIFANAKRRAGWFKFPKMTEERRARGAKNGGGVRRLQWAFVKMREEGGK